MVEKDYIKRVIENIFKFVRKLLQMDLEENQEAFIQESSDFLRDSFNVNINSPTEDSLKNIFEIVTNQDELKKINIILFRLSISQSSIDLDKGKNLYKLFKKTFEKNNKTFFFTKDKLDLEIDELKIKNEKN